MIASRMVGCGLILIGLIAVITESFGHRPSPESQAFNISHPADDQPVQVRYIMTYTIMHPGFFMAAGAVLLFCSYRVSRIVLFDLEDECESKPLEA